MISESIFQKNLEGLTYKEISEIRMDELNQQMKEIENENQQLKQQLKELKQQKEKGWNNYFIQKFLLTPN